MRKYVLYCLLFSFLFSCKEAHEETNIIGGGAEEEIQIGEDYQFVEEPPAGMETPEGMVWIPGGKFAQGAIEDDEMALDHEKPAHPVVIDGFFMDQTEVTNAQFKKFVEETGYVTVAEREIDWEEMKKQLPPGTPKPHDSIFQPGSLIFKKAKNKVPNLYDYSQWWDWKIGANWKQPYGKGSSIEGKENYPVVHIALEDALAYCQWAGRRLPTEAEWEYAARGGNERGIFTWGEDGSKLPERANTWEGVFPSENTIEDGFENKSPVKTFPPNESGVYDLAGNVWEWTQDWYNVQYYQELKNKGVVKNPQGAARAYNPANPQMPEKVIKGGSFLCNAAYCASFRISARMPNSTDSSQEHLGFRTVASVDMLQQ